MKKNLVLALAACSLSSVAMAGGLPVDMAVGNPATGDAGVYLGLGVGFGRLGLFNEEVDGKDKHEYSKKNGLVGRVFAGYDINRYFAVELGYGYFFNKAEIKATPEYTFKRTQAIDLLGKIKAPICEGFDLYAKVGANFLIADKNSFNVAYGLGIDWSITDNVVMGLEWLRYNGKEKSVSEEQKYCYLNHADAFMVTLRYKFDI